MVMVLLSCRRSDSRVQCQPVSPSPVDFRWRASLPSCSSSTSGKGKVGRGCTESNLVRIQASQRQSNQKWAALTLVITYGYLCKTTITNPFTKDLGAFTSSLFSWSILMSFSQYIMLSKVVMATANNMVVFGR